MALSFDHLLAEVKKHGLDVDLCKRNGVAVYDDEGKRSQDPLGEYDPPMKHEYLGVMKVVGNPKIWLYVGAPAGPKSDSEVCTLAHEFGHHQRWKAGERESAYERMIKLPQSKWKEESSTDRKLILTEETEAWAYAETTLRRLGFENWETFVADRDAAIADYRRRLVL